jgi:hypothetical protein
MEQRHALKGEDVTGARVSVLHEPPGARGLSVLWSLAR